MIPSLEFSVGKHNIGYLEIDFLPRLGHLELKKRPLPTFQKLPRYMTDKEIESELKPGFCELGDILAFLDNAPEECKDGNWNLFYTKAFVVLVGWRDFHGEWGVSTWDRDGSTWHAGRRVFSPATENSETKDLVNLDALELRLKKLEQLVDSIRALLVIN